MYWTVYRNPPLHELPGIHTLDTFWHNRDMTAPHTSPYTDTSLTASYRTALALGVLAYAYHDPTVARFVAAHISYSATMPQKAHGAIHPILLPHTRTQALRRTAWLLEEARRHPKHHMARTVLAQAIRVQNEPKAIVLGIDMGALPIGVWGKWKRKDHAMHVLVSKETRMEAPATQRALLTTTHRVVESGLIEAGGSTKHLEPELGEWLFGNKAIGVYTAPQRELTEIRTFLETLSAPHASIETERTQTLMALSPSLYLGDLPHHELIEPYKEASC